MSDKGGTRPCRSYVFRTLPALFEVMTWTQHLQYMSRVDDSKYHKTKVFLYAKGSFLEEGRHDCTVEVWTVPAPDREKGNWRQEQVCLARCTQFAWALPVSPFPFWGIWLNA